MTSVRNPEAIDLRDRVVQIVEEVIREKDLFLVEVSLRGQKGSYVVDVFLDSETGVNAEVLAGASREIGFVLETEDVIKGRYHLNVSSPGAERPLTHPLQFPKHIGRPFQIQLKNEGGAEGESFVGELLEVEENTLVFASSPTETVRIAFTDIESARVQLPW